MTADLTGYLPGIGRVRVDVQAEHIHDVTVLEPITDWDEQAAADGVLLPGLVDLQVNGFNGIDFNDPDLRADAVLNVAEQLWAQGVTGFCPTTISGPLEAIGHTIRTVQSARSAPNDLRARSVLGMHLEGPWISPTDGARGAHPFEHTRAAAVAELEELTRNGDVVLITVAPEVPGVLELTRYAVRHGIRVSLGHSDATPQEIRAGVDAGATLSTHLGNGAVSQLPRHPNLVWEQLAEDRLSSMFIADKHHLDLSTLRAMVRAKGAGRVLLVSDATSLAGRPPGQYTTPIGGAVTLAVDGRLSITDTPYLAGAALSLIHGLSTVLNHGILPPVDAVLATSLRAASFVSGDTPEDQSPPTGPLDLIGRRADLVLARWEPVPGRLVPSSTYASGVPVWTAP